MKFWKLGDRPEHHPRWQDQVELEMEMEQAGIAAHRKAVDTARKRGEMTRLAPHRHMLEQMVADMGSGLKAWLNGNARHAKRGSAAHYAWYKLKDFDPYLSSYITVRAAMDTLGLQRSAHGAAAMASRIALQLEHEGRMSAWIKHDPKLFYGVQKKLKAQKATALHKSRVNINRFNALLRKDLGWTNWQADEKRYIGLKLLDILCRATGHFSLGPDKVQRRRGKNDTPIYVVEPSEELTQYLIEDMAREEKSHPHFMPTLMPPKRWNGVRRGGYYTPFVRSPNLITFKADNEETRGAAMDEFDALDMPHVYDAVNRVQEVPWRINQRVLNVFREAYDRNLGIGKVLNREVAPLPKRPPGMERLDLDGAARRVAEAEWVSNNAKAHFEWRKAAAIVYGENSRRTTSGLSVVMTLNLAEKFKDREFYFPHLLDFRGRMYPSPAYLQPQGNDLARGLLTFGQGRPVTEDNGGAGWLAIHLANTWGMNKVSYDDRIQWVGDRADLWDAIAANPLGCLDWCGPGRKDPWQTLAAIFEWVRFRNEGFGMVSSLPVRVDGTCNGIQHLSALMRDPLGAASVNLVPSSAPRDIYKEVAIRLQSKLESICAAGGRPGELAAMWLVTFEGEIPREFTKNPVMVLPYGGTKESYFGSVQKWLADAAVPLPPDDRQAAITWIVGQLWDSVNDVVIQAKVCMEWLRACAKSVEHINQPIHWVSHTGFHVRHFYASSELKQIKTEADGKSVWVAFSDRTKKLSKRDQLQGISPNFVHSQDGTVNMETILLFVDDADGNRLPFTTIHDAFGTVAGEMWTLFKCIREAFVRVHEVDVLEGFRHRCVLMLRDHLYTTNDNWPLSWAWEEAERTVPPIPERGNLDLAAVREADYFFA
jgi:DNA-directed RNA polymerase